MSLPRLIVPKRHPDARGWFAETFNEARLRALGIDCPFVQDNQSYSQRAGTLRGLHFQAPPFAQAKLISVLRGRVLDVAVDVRRGSPTFGKHVSAELSAETGRQLYIPVGFAHGFLTLENDVVVNYKVSGLLRAGARRRNSLGRPGYRISPGRSRRAPSRSPTRIGGFPC